MKIMIHYPMDLELIYEETRQRFASRHLVEVCVRAISALVEVGRRPLKSAPSASASSSIQKAPLHPQRSKGSHLEMQQAIQASTTDVHMTDVSDASMTDSPAPPQDVLRWVSNT